ncbi:colicin V production protein [Xenorhabdus thuongxuanensis]|uniref:Colicin V production protein n=1 Tax=Xenorhabdus thuongxuanensis TaxID=1873484 RepID=A0A1Q5U307_9GAMM|nr:colicin V production protein [Xenorhabdus thuongxuanensis]
MSTEKNENLIYRAEALQHKREGWLGASCLNIPSSLSMCLLTGMLTFVFIVSIITFGSYSERVNITGTVVYDPPAVSLIAQNDGAIIQSPPASLNAKSACVKKAGKHVQCPAVKPHPVKDHR